MSVFKRVRASGRVCLRKSMLVFTLFSMFVCANRAQALMLTPIKKALSSKAQISLITISPGSDLYSAFGHSTLWVLDSENGIDRVYNYGTFDFEQPNFYLNFVRGHLDYTLSAYSFEEQFYQTQSEGRGIVQQVLNLDSVQKQRIYDFLEWNALPENAHYLYDFYLDNCSSRLRDVLQKGAGEQLQYDKSVSTPYSFREWMNIYLQPHPWSALGMNIGLGAPADKKTDFMTQMYLPENLKLGVGAASNFGRPLVKTENKLLYPFEKKTNAINPVLSFTIALFGIALILVFSKERFAFLSLGFDVLLFGLVAVLGLVLALLWVATDHWVCTWNTDLLWANPFAFVLFFLFGRHQGKKWVTVLSLGVVGLCFVYFSLGYLLPEKPMFVLFPLILAMQLRILYRLQRIRNKHKPA